MAAQDGVCGGALVEAESDDSGKAMENGTAKAERKPSMRLGDEPPLFQCESQVRRWCR